MKTINHAGKIWRLHAETETKLVFVPSDNLLAKWRKKRKLNQRDAAAELGMSQGQLARIELGTRVCPPEIMQRIQSGL